MPHNDAGLPPEIDTSKPHTARIYDYLLGGKDNFAADREVGDKMLAAAPFARTAARENRAFLGRAVRYLTAEAGIRQFLDIGTGLPAAGSVHQVAQAVDPSSRVVYADNDPLVLAHARALLTSAPEGRTGYLHADLRDPESILNDPVTRDILDFSQPVALFLVSVLHFIPDEEQPAEIIAALLGGLPAGSCLVATHVSSEHAPDTKPAGVRAYSDSGIPLTPRDHGDFARLAFGGLDLVPPGVVIVTDWRPAEPGPRPLASEVNYYGGVGFKR